ncbi:MAG TPA: DUF2939 domain-containing protein [Noviherbaspirillum sp.]|nr:DUF2939 domain-containing protein [Noviherbaspirillum sp.]
MKKSYIAASLVAALLAAGSYFSPHLALYQMKRAIQNHDADTFSEHVDFPALRDSIKGQMMAEMGREMNSQEMKGNPFAGIGQAFATAMIGPMVDAMISPTAVIAMMNTGKIESPGDQGKREPGSPSKDEPKDAPTYSVSYMDLNRVAFRLEGPNAIPTGFILRRDGVWNWKLSAIELPKLPRSKQ